MNSSSTEPARRGTARDEVIGLHLGLAGHLAGRFGNRGEPLDDLVQVALVGLLKAVDGFDPGRGVDFASYAIPTMMGEIKRHFRDKAWSARVPRRLKELKLDIGRAAAALCQDLKRTPTNADLASYLGVSEAEIRECQVASRAYSAMSLSTALGDEDSDNTLADVLAKPDKDMQSVEDREFLRPLLQELPARQRRIIAMRFDGNMTQLQIAEHLGISQMHVSRLLTRSLAQLREGLTAGHSPLAATSWIVR